MLPGRRFLSLIPPIVLFLLLASYFDFGYFFYQVTLPSCVDPAINVEQDAAVSHTEFNSSEQAPKPKYAITSSVFTANYAAMGLMLGYSIREHHDWSKLKADMVLLVLEQSEHNPQGITPENRTRLEAVGWKVHPVHEIEGIDYSKVRSWHKYNLNKLQLWSWTEYEKIAFLDADTVVKGDISDLFAVPGEFAAAPDVWWDIPIDTRFNSGVMVFRPAEDTFNKMLSLLSDPKYHKPQDADQAFLQQYYKHRFWGLPMRYNLNLVNYEFHRDTWRKLWPEALVVHFTMHKANSDPKKHCIAEKDDKGKIIKTKEGKDKGCNYGEPMEWFREQYGKMLKNMGWEQELPLLG